MVLKDFIKNKDIPLTIKTTLIIYLIVLLPILYLKEGDK